MSETTTIILSVSVPTLPTDRYQVEVRCVNCFGRLYAVIHKKTPAERALRDAECVNCEITGDLRKVGPA
jgi:hypothetical protein